MQESFDVDRDITRAESPPGAAYRDPALHRRILEAAFATSWQIVDGDAPGVGEAVPSVLLGGALAEPIVWTRAEDGSEWLGSNVCTHRGHLVCREPGMARELRCGYHGRSFGLDGRLRTAPGFEGAEGFPRREDDLATLPLERLGPLCFTRLVDGEPIASWLAPAATRFGWWPWDRLASDPSGTTSYEVAANWAVYVENYLEGLHIPWVHPGLKDEIVGPSYRAGARARHASLPSPAARGDHGPLTATARTAPAGLCPPVSHAR